MTKKTKKALEDTLIKAILASPDTEDTLPAVFEAPLAPALVGGAIKPTVIIKAWAVNGDKVAPPITASTTVANQETGYPPLQQVEYSLGGKPVNREETNGAFYLYSSILAWQQAGGTFTFEPTVSTAYSGYNKGAILAYQRADLSYGLVYSAIDNNTADFITTPSVIGTDWIDVSISGANAAFPDITDVPSTGTVTIYGAAVKTGTKTMRTDDSTVAGRYAVIETYNDVGLGVTVSAMASVDAAGNEAQCLVYGANNCRLAINVANVPNTGFSIVAGQRPKFYASGGGAFSAIDFYSSVFVEDIRGYIFSADPKAVMQSFPVYKQATNTWVTAQQVSGRIEVASGTSFIEIPIPTGGLKDTVFNINANFEWTDGEANITYPINTGTKDIFGVTHIVIDWATSLPEVRDIRYQYTYLD